MRFPTRPVSRGSNLVYGGDVYRVSLQRVHDCQSKFGYTTQSVFLEDVFGLDVAVCDGGFALRVEDLGVEVRKSSRRHGQHAQQAFVGRHMFLYPR
jgi:hypothetical protein